MGIDADGTFTDFVALDNRDDKPVLRIHKRLSTPGAPEQGIVNPGLMDSAPGMLVALRQGQLSRPGGPCYTGSAVHTIANTITK